jgi:hypothetical protein
MIVRMPHEPFNTALRDGSAGKKLMGILEELKPEAVYFTSLKGQRTGIIVVDMADSSKIPMYAEPFFLQFNADVVFHPAMTPEDLKRGGLEALGKKWG